MIDRPPLSPAAQAVLDAAEEALSDFENYGPNYTAAGIAAALRAAASQMEFVQDVQHLYAIAAELDGATTTSENDLEDAKREGLRYHAQYSSDGPHKLIIREHRTMTVLEVSHYPTLSESD
jgi:hypothetical protein